MPHDDERPVTDELAADESRRGLRSLLAPGHWFYILALFVPLGLVAVLFQTLRLHAVGTPILSWEYLDKIRSDVAFHLAVIVAWVGLFALIRRRWSRRLAVIALHIAFTVLSLTVIMTQLFFYLLDLMPNLDSFALMSLVFQVAVVKIIQSEANAWAVGVALAGAVLANFTPLVLNWRLRPRRLSKAPETPAAPAYSRRRIALVTVGSVVGLLVLSGLPNVSDSTNFTRNRVVSLAMDAARLPFQEPPEGFREPTRDDIPDRTRLVPTEETQQYNIVMIVLESHGWVSTSLANPELDTTPVLAELAKSSLVANRAFTVVPNTTKSLVTSNCGVVPPPDTANSEARPGGLASRCLASLLAEQGYDTAYFQSATRTFENREKVVRGFGFEHFNAEESYDTTGFHPVNTLGYEDDIMVEPSLEWARSRGDKPFFLEYLTVTAHTKYVMPEGFETVDYGVEDELHNDYLNGVRYQDRFVGKVIDGFREAGLADNTIFVVMADHGEAFREHGRRLHSDVPWNEGLQIPLLIKAPGLWEDGEVIDHTVQNLALLPTLVDLLGYRVEGGTYPASSILAAEADEHPRMSTCWNGKQCLVYFPDDRHKYLYFYDYLPAQYYDLAADPHEQDNLIDTLSDEERDELERKVLVWRAEVEATHDLARRLARER